MSPREALNIFDNVGARFTGSREDHVNIQSTAAGTTALDISTNALNGTLSGSPTPILTPDVPRLLRPRRKTAFA